MARWTHAAWIAALMGAAVAGAQTIEVSDAWVRATVAGQSATGAFMKIKSTESAKLVSASASVAGVTEVHEMKMEQNIMKMAAIPSLQLPAGQWVELRPGGHHVMLMDLKGPLADKSSITLNLVFENAKGVRSTQQVQVPVRAMGVSAPKAHEHKH